MDNLQLRFYKKHPFRIVAKKDNSIFVNQILYRFVATEQEIIPNAGEQVVQAAMPPQIKGQIVKISYIRSENIILIATVANLTTYTINSGQFCTTPYQGSNAPIVQTAWNPSQSILIVIDDAGLISGYTFNALLRFTADYQFWSYGTVSLHAVVPNQTYLGWGARDTQFNGSTKQIETREAVPLPPSPPIISWRGNGELFVVNYWKNSRRFLKVFTACLVPTYQSLPFNTLLAPTSFKAQGNFIACAATTGLQNMIVIYEKNCQMKAFFAVKECVGLILDVQYHGSQHVLAVHSQLAMTHYVNIFLYSNGVWYLKQQLPFLLRDEDDFLKFRWINEIDSTSFQFNVLTSRSSHAYEYALDTFGVHNDLVGVINGNTVLFTDFSKIMPPPMATHNLTFERPVNHLRLYPTVNVYGFVLSDEQVKYYQYDQDKFHSYDGALLGNEPSVANTMTSYETVCDGIVYKIHLNTRQELFVREHRLASNVLSVHLHGSYLLFTCLYKESCKLYCIRFTPEKLHSLVLGEIFSRTVEQGAKIICVTKQDHIILVMPRGNFETITSRLISIDTLESLLQENKWEAALVQIQHQKLNWNLLIDMNMHRFRDHIDDFVSAAVKLKVLSVVASEFSSEDCMLPLYEEWAKTGRVISTSVLIDDVKELTKADVFRLLLGALKALNPIEHLIPIVILQFKHFSLKSALASICDVCISNTECGKSALTEVRRHKQTADIIKSAYTLFSPDFLELIYAMLGKDPMVYLPKLEALRNMNEIDLRFTMSVEGKEFEIATRYLIRSAAQSDSFVISFVKKHGTQYTAYNDLPQGHERFKLVTVLYADYLGMKAQHNEAGLILERAGLKAEALIRYKIGRNWRKVVSISNVLELKPVEMNEILIPLAKDLATNKQFDEAAFIYEHYCSDHQAAVQLLIEANMFERAVCLAQKYESDDFIETVIEPQLKKYREELHERLRTLDRYFQEYTDRLLKLRKRKYENILSTRNPVLIDIGMEDPHLTSDNVSEYGSIVSASSMATSSSTNSRSSTVSSRNRRKLERKKIDIRPGSVYQDIALIRELYLLAMELLSLREEIMALSFCVVGDNFEFVKTLRDYFATIYGEVYAAIPRIWSDIFLNADPSSDDPADMAVISNRHVLDDQFRAPPPLEMLENWDW